MSRLKTFEWYTAEDRKQCVCLLNRLKDGELARIEWNRNAPGLCEERTIFSRTHSNRRVSTGKGIVTRVEQCF